MSDSTVVFNKIPLQRPITPLLDQIEFPAQLRLLDEDQLPQLSRELREYLLYAVGQTGGHFGSGLGVVELTIALHYVYNTPNDRLVWDVGHQCYPHKILTGRRDEMLTMRQTGGLSPFPKRSESEFDTFGVGHSSTSISAAQGMALANTALENGNKVAAIIGDGAMTAGMAFEALHHAAHTRANMLVILNDNNMSISHNEGGLSTYFSKIWASKLYTSMREGGKKVLSNLPPALELVRRTEEHMKGMVSPGTLFEELGFNYIGPLDGHDLPSLVHYLQNLREMEGPQLLHVMTQKGKGFEPAEADPVGYHALSKVASKVEGAVVKPVENNSVPNKQSSAPKYSDVFGDWLCDTASRDSRLVGITPAMCEGSGMVRFSKEFPKKYHDVAIAEQHAVTFAAGLACEGMKPVVAIYSTFLQRAYDQLVHDVAIQKLDVLFAIDRAGLVGEDGATHAGSFDLSFLRSTPNMLIMAPSNENETRQMLHTGYQYKGPAAVRYPRGAGTGVEVQQKMQALEIGKSRTIKEGRSVAILAFGSMVNPCINIADRLDATLVDMRFVKPLDTKRITDLAKSHDLIVTVEENTICGGAGSGVIEYLIQEGVVMPFLQIGLPDEFLPHGTPADLLHSVGLDSAGIEASIQKRLDLLSEGRRALP